MSTLRYKRSLLTARRPPEISMPKRIITLINAVADVVNNDPDKWRRMWILNVAWMGKFASDRSIRE
jgi:hypothetical protein